jgi:hypothetical protein
LLAQQGLWSASTTNALWLSPRGRHGMPRCFLALGPRRTRDQVRSPRNPCAHWLRSRACVASEEGDGRSGHRLDAYRVAISGGCRGAAADRSEVEVAWADCLADGSLGQARFVASSSLSSADRSGRRADFSFAIEPRARGDLFSGQEDRAGHVRNPDRTEDGAAPASCSATIAIATRRL